MTQTCLTVKVFTAGDHFAGDEKPADATDLIELLLKRSGYTKPYDWECRVDKLKHCSSESRPIRLIGFKSYGVIMRVKPRVHATADYQMTLYIPQGSGYSAKNLFEQLRANEKSISRVIRQQDREEKIQEKESSVHTITPVVQSVIAPAPPIPLAPPISVVNGTPFAATEYRPEFKTLQAVVKNDDKLKYVLEKIEIVNGYKFCRNRLQFNETLRHECKWDKDGHAKVAISRTLSELVKHDYLMETVNERDTLVGYTLTEKGKSFIEQHKNAEPMTVPAPVKKEAPVKIDIPALLTGMKDKLRELADVANRIAANNLQKAELQQTISNLDKENEELSKVIHQNKECQEVLSKLGQFITPLPIQGVRQTV